jgi:thiamine biosynthesis protein ThiS
VRVFVNGEARDVPDGATVETLLAALAIDRRRIAVERNREIVPRAAHATTPLAPDDRVEIVTMVGGG